LTSTVPPPGVGAHSVGVGDVVNDAGVGHHDLDRAEGVDDVVVGPGGGLGVGDVEDGRHGPAAALDDLLGGVGHAVVPVAGGDRPAGRGERTGDDPADALRGAGHEGGTAIGGIVHAFRLPGCEAPGGPGRACGLRPDRRRSRGCGRRRTSGPAAGPARRPRRRGPGSHGPAPTGPSGARRL